MEEKPNQVFMRTSVTGVSRERKFSANSDKPTKLSGWEDLPSVALDPKVLAQNRIVAHETERPDAAVFSVLRTKVLLEAQQKGWKRVAITSPTRGCGKSFVVANLAISLSTHPDLRTVLLDLDLRQPSLSNYLGVHSRYPISDALTGKVAPDQVLSRIGARLAVGIGVNALPNSGAVLNSQKTGEVLQSLQENYAPDIMLFDTPPANALDDLLALCAHTDAVIIVLGGGSTTQDEVKMAQSLVAKHTNLLGMVLNKSLDKDPPVY